MAFDPGDGVKRTYTGVRVHRSGSERKGQQPNAFGKTKSKDWDKRNFRFKFTEGAAAGASLLVLPCSCRRHSWRIGASRSSTQTLASAYQQHGTTFRCSHLSSSHRSKVSQCCCDSCRRRPATHLEDRPSACEADQSARSVSSAGPFILLTSAALLEGLGLLSVPCMATKIRPLGWCVVELGWTGFLLAARVRVTQESGPLSYMRKHLAHRFMDEAGAQRS